MKELSLNILDISENSTKAGATLVEISVTEKDNVLTLVIKDNGCGMDEETVRSVTNPFYTTRTTRKVGMGIPLFKLAAEQTGGSFTITSQVGVGTRVDALFKTDSIDFTPLGDMASTIATIVSMNEDKDFVYTRSIDGKEFTFKSADIKVILDGVPLSEPSVMSWIEDYIAENTLSIERNE